MRKAGRLIIITPLIISCILTGCMIGSNGSNNVHNTTVIGSPDNIFRHRWWNYYERGISYIDRKLWLQAETDLRKAISQRAADQFRARTYGMHTVDYFPHRELGIVLFNQGRYHEAIHELEISISTIKTAKAEYFINHSRRVLIEQQETDYQPPTIHFTNPSESMITTNSSITISGTVSDDTFVKGITVNDKPVRIDVSAPHITFNMNIRLRLGENKIVVKAQDLTGKSTQAIKTVISDRTGPIVSIEDVIPTTGRVIIKGYAYDDIGIKGFSINGFEICPETTKDMTIDTSVNIPPDLTTLTLFTEDIAGNRTTAEVPIPGRTIKGACRPRSETMVASLDLFPGCLPKLRSKYHKDLLLQNNSKPDRKTPLYLASKTSRGGGGKLSNKLTPIKTGKNYALLIGINNYTDWQALKTPIDDILSIEHILISKYGFKKEHIIKLVDSGATKAALYDALMNMTAKLLETDNLFIYFAGHGKLHKHANDGYWIPVKGKKNNEIWTWVAHSAVKNIITSEEFRAKNVMLIVDSCYGGNLMRGSGLDSENPHHTKLLELSKKKSRQVISSGGLEPVADWGRDNHSLFAFYLLKGLKENSEPVIALKNIFNSYIWEPVFNKSTQTPQIGRLKTTMDEGGEFVLFLEETSFGSNELVSDISSTPSKQTNFQKIGFPPAIDIQRWSDNQIVFLDKVYIDGIIKDDEGLREAKINGRSIIRRPSKAIYFNHVAELKPGDNPFVFCGEDFSGNESQKTVHIYRKIQKVFQNASRMSTILFPLSIKGSNDTPLTDTLFSYLFNSGRFHIKQLQRRSLPREKVTPFTNKEMSKVAKEMGVEFTISGTATFGEDSVEIRLSVIEAQTMDVVAEVDVYGEGLSRQLIRDLCCGLVIKIKDALPLIEGKTLNKGKKIFINMGRAHGLRRSMHLVFFKEEDPIIDPETGVSLGVDFTELGAARIEKIQDKISMVKLLDGEALDLLTTGQRFVMQ